MALGYMRRHRRWLFGFLWLVIAAFIILYIPAFQDADAGSPGETLAMVGDLPITVGEFQRSYLRQRQMYERIYQGRMDPATLRSLGLEDQTLEGLVNEKLVLLEARRLGLEVDDATVARTLATSPEFQEDGRFLGSAEIRRRLELQGVTVGEFERSLRNQILRDRLESLVTDGASVTPEEVEQEFRKRTEQVKAEYVLVDAARFRPQASASDAEVQSRFAERKDAYRLPEKRVLSYVLVDPTSLQSRVTLTDRDLETYYQERREDFKEEEQACASHILVKVKPTPEATEGHPEEEARKLAQKALDQVKAGGDFAALATKLSEDQGSASGGGDLGCFPRGRMVPEFENAAFSMQPGETSDLVKSSMGFHVIRLGSRREETYPALSQVKERIRQVLLSQRAGALGDEKSRAVGAALASGKSLEEAAQAQGLSVQKSTPVARGETLPALASPTLVAKAFELKPGQVERSPFRLPRGTAFIALSEVQPARTPELKEVAEKVKADLLQEKAQAQARTLAAELRVRAEKDGLEKAATALGLVRKETPALVGRGQPLADLGTGAALEEAAYTLPEKTLSEPLPTAGGWAVIRVLEKKGFDPVAFEAQKASIASSLRQERKGQLFRSYMTLARERFPVERRPEALQRVVG